MVEGEGSRAIQGMHHIMAKQAVGLSEARGACDGCMSVVLGGALGGGSIEESFGSFLFQILS